MSETSDINSARYITEDNKTISVTYRNGRVVSVPPNESNRFYQDLQEWEKEEGNAISPYVPPERPPAETDIEKMERINGLTVAEMRVVLGITGSNPENRN